MHHWGGGWGHCWVPEVTLVGAEDAIESNVISGRGTSSDPTADTISAPLLPFALFQG